MVPPHVAKGALDVIQITPVTRTLSRKPRKEESASLCTSNNDENQQSDMSTVQDESQCGSSSEPLDIVEQIAGHQNSKSDKSQINQESEHGGKLFSLRAKKTMSTIYYDSPVEYSSGSEYEPGESTDSSFESGLSDCDAINKIDVLKKGRTSGKPENPIDSTSSSLKPIYPFGSNETMVPNYDSESDVYEDNRRLVPLTNDCVLMTNHVKTVANDALKLLEVTPNDTTAWSDLNHAILAHLILFNRHRQGEMSKMTLLDFKAKHTAEHGDITDALSPLEQQLTEYFPRIEIIGKRGRVVPVLLTAEMKSQVEKLIETREFAGVNPQNKFVFARPRCESLSHIRGCDALRIISEQCGAQHPELIRSTRLRKQVATMSQVLNLKKHELDILANYLGHDSAAQREFYRLPQETLQVAKVTKILIAMEHGTLMKQKGLSLDEINVDVTEEIPFEEEESDAESSDETDETETQDLVQASSSDKEVVPPVKRRKISVKVPWSAVEKDTVLRHFGKEILLKKVPGKAAIDACIKREPCLARRTWRNVKDHIWNTVKPKKQ